MDRRLPNEVELQAAFRLQPGACYMLRLTHWMPAPAVQQLREQLAAKENDA